MLWRIRVCQIDSYAVEQIPHTLSHILYSITKKFRLSFAQCLSCETRREQVGMIAFQAVHLVCLGIVNESTHWVRPRKDLSSSRRQRWENNSTHTQHAISRQPD
jgi:hypothetical protein